MLPSTMTAIVSQSPSLRTMPSAPRAQLIGAMFAPAQIHICCSPVESLSASGMGSILWTSTRSSALVSVAMIVSLAPCGCPVASRHRNGVTRSGNVSVSYGFRERSICGTSRVSAACFRGRPRPLALGAREVPSRGGFPALLPIPRQGAQTVVGGVLVHVGEGGVVVHGVDEGVDGPSGRDHVGAQV